MEKKKILVLSDHCFAFSGVGIQTRHVVEALLKTGRFQILQLGGALKHNDYRPAKTQEYGDDLIVHPVDGYGNPDMVRSVLRSFRPDLVWFMTDPRFWEWLWQMEDEIRPLCPMLYYHDFDNYPYPKYNRNYYLSTDVIASISKITQDIVETVAPEVESIYLPHAVNTEIFKPLSTGQRELLRKDNFGSNSDKFVYFFNSRNARRKMTGSIVYWFKTFLDKHNLHEKAQLIMHTDPYDDNGPNLERIAKDMGLIGGQIQFSTGKLGFPQLAALYSMTDCFINISDAEGFGLGVLESLSCGTPAIGNMTGGIQEQITDGKDFFGVGIVPCSKTIVGSQSVPYVFEDRISEEQFHDALWEMFNMPLEERLALGLKGREHVLKNYNFEDFQKNWISLVDKTIEKHGSWQTRKNYKPWELREVK